MKEYDIAMAQLLEKSRPSNDVNPHYGELRRLLGEEFESITKEGYLGFMQYILPKYNIDGVYDLGSGSGNYINPLNHAVKTYAFEKDTLDKDSIQSNLAEHLILGSNPLNEVHFGDVPEIVPLLMMNEILHCHSTEKNSQIIRNALDQGINYHLVGENLYEYNLDQRLMKLTTGRLYHKAEIMNLYAMFNMDLVEYTVIGTRMFLLFKRL